MDGGSTVWNPGYVFATNVPCADSWLYEAWTGVPHPIEAQDVRKFRGGVYSVNVQSACTEGVWGVVGDCVGGSGNKIIELFHEHLLHPLRERLLVVRSLLLQDLDQGNVGWILAFSVREF